MQCTVKCAVHRRGYRGVCVPERIVPVVSLSSKMHSVQLFFTGHRLYKPFSQAKEKTFSLLGTFLSGKITTLNSDENAALKSLYFMILTYSRSQSDLYLDKIPIHIQTLSFN